MSSRPTTPVLIWSVFFASTLSLMSGCVLTFDSEFDNLCGGSSRIDELPGASCGPCGDGEWVCDGEEAVVCLGASQECTSGTIELCEGGDVNECGGCTTLALDISAPDACPAGEVAYCVSPELATCLPSSSNACGGTGALRAPDGIRSTPIPGSPCGECQTGYLRCDSEDALVCEDTSTPNACGGCNSLRAVVGQSCACGEWTCSPESPDLLLCTGHDRLNACGGCVELSEAVGTSCGDNQIWVCDGTNAVTCAEATRNPCGGRDALEGEPLDACGPCGDGVAICAARDVLACVDASTPNACGGCGFNLSHEPGDRCGPDHEWECDRRSGSLVCASQGDRDRDGVVDERDVCPDVPDPDQADTDSDGVGDACQDDDLDEVPDEIDNCPTLANPSQSDLDLDGLGDACDGDRDGDGIANARDNCANLANPAQSDTDFDTLGDACDADDDGDGLRDEDDNCSGRPNPDQGDQNADGVGDACQDSDSDGLLDHLDNCPDVPNPGQADLDRDGEGDLCDADEDGDGVEELPGLRPCADSRAPDCSDNCPRARNPGQADRDADGIGDACDEDGDGDGQAAPLDCDDRDDTVYAGAPEVCDGVDNNCDGRTDADDPDVLTITWYADVDGDGAGADPALGAPGTNDGEEFSPVVACDGPEGYVDRGGDCDDNAPDVFVGAPEVCNDGVDNSCDGRDACRLLGELSLAEAPATIRVHNRGDAAPVIAEMWWVDDILIVSLAGEFYSGWAVWNPDARGVFGIGDALIQGPFDDRATSTPYRFTHRLLSATRLGPDASRFFSDRFGFEDGTLVALTAAVDDSSVANEDYTSATVVPLNDFDVWTSLGGLDSFDGFGRTILAESGLLLESPDVPRLAFGLVGPQPGAPALPEGVGSVAILTEGLAPALVLPGPIFEAIDAFGLPLPDGFDDLSDEYGREMTGCDLDGDGADELVVGAPGADLDRGLLDVFAGPRVESSRPTTIRTAVLDAELGARLVCASGLRELEIAGQELIVLAPGYAPSMAAILSIADLTGESELSFDGLDVPRIRWTEDGSRLHDVAAGDFDGDGWTDLAFGLSYDRPIRDGDPLATLFYGPFPDSRLGSEADVTIRAERRFDGGEVRIVLAGDGNRDGYDDLAIAVARTLGTSPLVDADSEVYVFFGAGR